MQEEEIIRTLKTIGAAPLKELGQHFLICDEVLDDSIRVADISSSDTVIEVGPGLGVLTEKLLGSAGHVIVIEKDRKYIAYLKNKLHKFLPSKLTIIDGDILQVNIPHIIEQHASALGHRYKVVANLPYNIASQVIMMFLVATKNPTSITALVQKEVAERIAAKPPRMNLLALKVQRLARPEIIKHVGPECFYPSPSVDSSLLHIAGIGLHSLTLKEKDRALLIIAKCGFSSPRKTLTNNLARLHLPKIITEAALKRLNKSPLTRPQELSLKEWSFLAEDLMSHINSQ